MPNININNNAKYTIPLDGVFGLIHYHRSMMMFSIHGSILYKQPLIALVACIFFVQILTSFSKNYKLRLGINILSCFAVALYAVLLINEASFTDVMLQSNIYLLLIIQGIMCFNLKNIIFDSDNPIK